MNPRSDAAEAALQVTRPVGTTRSTILWVLFFLGSFALGYPTLNRYDPRILGLDQGAYYQMVVGHPSGDDNPFYFRVLVPYTAKPFYWLAQRHIGTWNPVWFGMLAANSLFCATFLLLLLHAGQRALGDLRLSLLACMLVLVNYATADLWLSGYVDTSEACLLMAVAALLLADTWWPLPLIGIAGGLAKQSFLPFATVFAVSWWFSLPKSGRSGRRLAWVMGMSGAAFLTLVLAHWAISGVILWPWQMASAWWGGQNILVNARELLKDYRLWYAFVWLLPLGVWHLRRLPKPWVRASIVTGSLAIGFAFYTDMAGNLNRPLFNIIAPIFSLSAASLICTDDAWKLRRHSRG